MQALISLKEFVEYCTNANEDVITSDDLKVEHQDMVAVLKSTGLGDNLINAKRVCGRALCATTFVEVLVEHPRMWTDFGHSIGCT